MTFTAPEMTYAAAEMTFTAPEMTYTIKMIIRNAGLWALRIRVNTYDDDYCQLRSAAA